MRDTVNPNRAAATTALYIAPHAARPLRSGEQQSTGAARFPLALWAWTIPILLVVMWVGARGLYADTLWIDEVHSIEDSGGPPVGYLTPAQIWSRIAQSNASHTPGYFIVLSVWAQAVGWEPPALRALSLFAGLLTVAFTYRLGVSAVSPRVGLFAAVVIGASAFFAHFLHELRMYSIVTMLVAFETWWYYRIITRRREPRWSDWLGLYLGAAALLYTHYFAALPLLGLCAYHLLFASKNRRWWGVALIIALAGLSFLPWVGTLLTGLRAVESMDDLHTRSLTTGQALEQLIRLWSNGGALLLATVLLLAVTGLHGGARLVAVAAVVTLGLLLGANAVLKLMHAGRLRYLVPAWPLLSILIAVGLVQLKRFLPRSLQWRRSVPSVALAAWAGIGIFQIANPAFTAGLDGSNYLYPLHHAAYRLRDVRQPDDLVLQYIADWTATSYLNFNRLIREFYFEGVDDAHYRIFPWQPSNSPTQDEELEELLAELSAADRQRVWLIYPPRQDVSFGVPSIMETLDARYHQCAAAVDVPDLRVEQYTLAPVCCLSREMSAAPRLTFGSGIGLVGIDPLPETAAGMPLRFGSLWSIASDVPPHTYSVTIQMFDVQGNKVGQADYGLIPQPLACEQVEIATAGLTPGDYVLRIAVYGWQTGERLPAANASTGETGDMISLATVRLVEAS